MTQIDMMPENTGLVAAWLGQFLYGSEYWPKDTSKLSGTDWMWFTFGLFLGALITIATSAFNVFFDPCLVQWATITATMFFFYLYMSSYMDSNFSNSSFL